MRKIIVLLAVIGRSYSSIWGSRGHDEYGGLTLGEIALDHHDSRAFNRGETDFSGHHSSLLNEVDDWHFNIDDFHANRIIPVVKHIGVPTIIKVPLAVPQPFLQAVPQPYPVAVVVPKPVPYEVSRQVIRVVEKKVPTPVEKIVPFKVEKWIPFHVVKHVPVPVEQPIPIKIPIYKTIVHQVKDH